MSTLNHDAPGEARGDDIRNHPVASFADRVGMFFLRLVYAFIAEPGVSFGLRRIIVRLTNDLVRAQDTADASLKKERIKQIHANAIRRLRKCPWYGWPIAVLTSMAIMSPIFLIVSVITIPLATAYLVAQASLFAYRHLIVIAGGV